MRTILLVLCCAILAVLLSAGCTAPGNPGPAITSEPTNEPTPLPTPEPVAPPAAVTPYETIPPVPVPPAYTRTAASNLYPRPAARSYGSPVPASAAPEITDPARISFRSYADQNFAISYPSDWTVTGTGTGYVQFRSPGGKLSFTARVSDLLPGLVGNVRLNPDIAAVRDMVSREFPGYSAESIMSDYQTLTINSVPATGYSVRAGPVAYHRYIIVSLHHVYTMTFSTDPAVFATSESLRQYMFNTLAIYDPA